MGHRLPAERAIRGAGNRYAGAMTSLIVSTIAYFIAAFFIRQWLNSMDIPRTLTRGIVIFVGAAAVSYGVAIVLDWLIA